MKVLRKLGMAAMLVGCASLAAGCLAVAAAGAAAAGVAYVEGSLKGALPASPQEVVEAGEAVLNEMGLLGVSAKATEVDGRIEARTSGDDKVVIKVDRKGENVSGISIRVGVFGDKELSRTIYDRIEAKLKD
jgi:hypothetical protein